MQCIPCVLGDANAILHVNQPAHTSCKHMLGVRQPLWWLRVDGLPADIAMPCDSVCVYGLLAMLLMRHRFQTVAYWWYVLHVRDVYACCTMHVCWELLGVTDTYRTGLQEGMWYCRGGGYCERVRKGAL